LEFEIIITRKKSQISRRGPESQSLQYKFSQRFICTNESLKIDKPPKSPETKKSWFDKPPRPPDEHSNWNPLTFSYQDPRKECWRRLSGTRVQYQPIQVSDALRNTRVQSTSYFKTTVQLTLTKITLDQSKINITQFSFAELAASFHVNCQTSGIGPRPDCALFVHQTSIKVKI